MVYGGPKIPVKGLPGVHLSLHGVVFAILSKAPGGCTPKARYALQFPMRRLFSSAVRPPADNAAWVPITGSQQVDKCHPPGILTTLISMAEK
jgi:hypothetical protein